MIFNQIQINNFRQYFGETELDLSTNTKDARNIVLIGGRNGYGKTNLLLAIVWCLYGDKITQIDEHFKREIQKEKNYASFMQQSLNWTAKKNAANHFSVSILVSDLDLPQTRDFNSKSNKLVISRTFNVPEMKESLSIRDSYNGQELIIDETEKVDFINDHIIPIDAAKFVFFDGEKISEIANLSIKEEGSFINDALNQILGLDVYDSLIEDIDYYITDLKKKGAKKNLQEQIIDKERAIELSNLEIDKLEEENAEILKSIDDYKKDIRSYDSLITQRGNNNQQINRDAVHAEIEQLKNREEQLTNNFFNISEIIPLVLLTGKLEEVQQHLELQEINKLNQTSSWAYHQKLEAFIEALFNKPPEPENSTMSLKDKMFYYDKAKGLISSLFDDNTSSIELPFEHDLNNTERQLISDAITLVGSQSNEVFQTTIEDLNEVRSKLKELNQKLRKIDAGSEDELVLDYSSKKEAAQYEIEESNKKIGQNTQQANKLRKDIERLKQQLSLLIKRVDIDAINKLKIKESEKYVGVLKSFLEDQKKSHKDSLERSILQELRILMHKLSSKENTNKFIEDVKVTILASGQGMKVALLDQYDEEIKKETLSSGEKQIYISCLIKAILKESIKALPIFIDTPLGRLDEQHRDLITKLYYPSLSEQVVLFSTNSEITPRRYDEITSNISKSYVLINDGLNTKVNKGYFHNYEN